MEGERVGRVVAVALLALLTPVACAAAGVCTPSASGLPPSSSSASPAVQLEDGEEAPTAEAFEIIIRSTRHWAVPVDRQPRRHAMQPRVRVTVPSVNHVIGLLTGQKNTGPATEALLEPALGGSTTTTALGAGDLDT